MALLGGSARIASKLERKSCERVDLDYRFGARFEREDATVVTDQQTVSVEDVRRQRARVGDPRHGIDGGDRDEGRNRRA
ncbi:MAG: hypothetical protein H7Y08_11375 [Rhizobiaceae bacterium]|nr:hypothetical protein [Rhizobiaceae bacterium]